LDVCISVYNQPPKSTQPCITPGQLNQVPTCLAGFNAGHVHPYQVAGNNHCDLV